MHQALAAAGASTSAAIRYGNLTGELKPGADTIIHIVNSYVFCLFVELFIHDHSEAVYLANIVIFLGFIQNHRKGWPASAAGLQKNPYGADFLPLEVLDQNSFSCIGNMDHNVWYSFQQLF